MFKNEGSSILYSIFILSKPNVVSFAKSGLLALELEPGLLRKKIVVWTS